MSSSSVSVGMQEPAPPAAVGVEQEEEGPMFFQDSRTLLQIYAELEEQNLFLIQNAQESEEALEELRAKFRCPPHLPLSQQCPPSPSPLPPPPRSGPPYQPSLPLLFGEL